MSTIGLGVGLGLACPLVMVLTGYVVFKFLMGRAVATKVGPAAAEAHNRTENVTIYTPFKVSPPQNLQV